MPPDIAIWGLAVAVLAHMLAMFFKSPKEAGADMERRLQVLEQYQISTAGNHGRHDQSLETLTLAIERLTTRIDDMMKERSSANRGRN